MNMQNMQAQYARSTNTAMQDVNANYIGIVGHSHEGQQPHCASPAVEDKMKLNSEGTSLDYRNANSNNNRKEQGNVMAFKTENSGKISFW